jgi:hypothetical protein
MDLRIRPLGDPAPVREALQDDGWTLDPQPDGSFLASNADVPDEAAARRRLDALGLLTSNAVQIDFQPTRPRD